MSNPKYVFPTISFIDGVFIAAVAIVAVVFWYITIPAALTWLVVRSARKERARRAEVARFWEDVRAKSAAKKAAK